MERKVSATTVGVTKRELPRTFISAEDQSPWRRRFGVIYLALRQRITTLEYAPGARLDMDLLSNEFGVSRTPVRNVLQRLDLEGLVRTRHGVGTIVAPLDLEDFHQAVRLRIELASLIGKFPASTIAPSAIDNLHRASSELAYLPDVRDPIVFARIDMRVHDVISTVVGNTLMRRVFDEMYFRTARLRFYFLAQQSLEDEVSVLSKDVELLRDAMEQGDLDGVGALVGNSIHETFTRMKPLLDTLGSHTTPSLA